MRTNGAGGNNTSFDAGPYSEGLAGMTLALHVRNQFIATPDYPTTTLIENVGVRPDFESNYMTKDNLLQSGFQLKVGVFQGRNPALCHNFPVS
jgi:hypothetical protein